VNAPLVVIKSWNVARALFYQNLIKIFDYGRISVARLSVILSSALAT